jgi:hypothetical protein
VRLAFELALEGDGTSGPMGVKTITKHLNERRIFTRDGGRWGIGTVHRMLTRATYAGRHEFNKRGKSKELKPATEVIAVEVPAIIDQAMFDAMQAHLKARSSRSRQTTAPRHDANGHLLYGQKSDLEDRAKRPSP